MFPFFVELFFLSLQSTFVMLQFYVMTKVTPWSTLVLLKIKTAATYIIHMMLIFLKCLDSLDTEWQHPPVSNNRNVYACMFNKIYHPVARGAHYNVYFLQLIQIRHT